MKKTYFIALLIISVISVWMLSGVFFPAKSKHQDQSLEKTTASTKEPVKVRVKHLTAQNQHIEVVVMGRTEAKRLVDVKAEIGGRIVSVPAEKGQRVKAGDVLCELAEDDRRAQLARAKATVEKAQIDYDGALTLQKNGLISSTAIASNKSALEGARANLKVAELNVAHLQMRAPFAGFVEDRPAEIGALIDRNGICARLLDESSLLAIGQVAEKDVQKLVLGQTVQVLLSGGDLLNGKISFIARTADKETRTYSVEAELDVNNNSVRDGITAKIIIPLQEVLAHHMSPAVLALDDSGRVGVRIVNSESKVEFHYVAVVRETADGVWVTGLPAEIDLITVGQELVSDGDQVQAINMDEKPAAAGTAQ